jgi:hypothetical protein
VDPFTLDPRIRVGGTQVPATAATQAYKLHVPFAFWQAALNDDMVFAPSSDQLRIPGQKITLDLGAQAQAGGTAVLTSGTANVIVTDVKLYAVLVEQQSDDGRQKVPHIGPAWQAKQRTVTQQRDTDSTPHLPLLLADERAFATVEAQCGYFTVERDEKAGPKRVSPSELAMDYTASQFPASAIPNAYDVTSHALGGVVLTPLIWVQRDATDYDWPMCYRSRVIDQTPASGGSPNATHLDVRILPIDLSGTQDQMRNLLDARKDTSVTSLDQLHVRGGGSPGNNKAKLFKGRYLAKAA